MSTFANKICEMDDKNFEKILRKDLLKRMGYHMKKMN